MATEADLTAAFGETAAADLWNHVGLHLRLLWQAWVEDYNPAGKEPAVEDLYHDLLQLAAVVRVLLVLDGPAMWAANGHVWRDDAAAPAPSPRRMKR